MTGAAVVGLDVFTPRLPLRHTFVHRHATRAVSTPVLVRLRLGDGTMGFGEAQPRDYVTGETETSVVRAIETDLTALTVGRHVPDLEAAAALLRSPGARLLKERRPAAFCAVELALLDAAGRRGGVSIGSILGDGRRTELPLDGAVVGFLPRAALVPYLRRIRTLGKRWVKVKVGDAGDVERLEAVREVLGEGADIIVDANGAWTAHEATERLGVLSRFRLTAAEQPVARGDIEGMAEVTRSTAVPVMADESLCTLADAHHLLEARACSRWNLRVGKHGGLLATLELLELARTEAIECHLGVLVGETSLLRAAGWLLASGAPEVARIECDELGLAEDVVTMPLIPSSEGEARVPPGPGLGVEMVPFYEELAVPVVAARGGKT